MVFSALPLTPSISADAATYTESTVKDFGSPTSYTYYGNNRDKSNGYFQTCNDGADGNFCAAAWQFSLSNIPTNIVDIGDTKVGFHISQIDSNGGSVGKGTKGLTFYVFKDWQSSLGTTGTRRAQNLLGLIGERYKLNEEPYKPTATNTADNPYYVTISKDIMLRVISEKWDSLNILAIQENVGGGSTANGWSDITLKAVKCVTSITGVSFSSADDSLVSYYENKIMKNGIPYTDMSTVYDRYCQISALKDAINYGENTNVSTLNSQLTTLYSNFKNELLTMTSSIWCPKRGEAVGKILSADAKNTQSGYVSTAYSNLLYSSTNCSTTVEKEGKANGGNLCYQIYAASNNVMLYDGLLETGYPVVVRLYSNNKSGQTAYGTFINANSNNFKLNRYWYGYYENSNSVLTQFPTGGTALDISSDNALGTGGSGWKARYYGNACYFNGAFSNGEYYKSFTGTSQAGFSAYCSGIGTTTYSNNSTQYVINYAPIVEKINEVMTYLKMGAYPVNDYKEGGLKSFLQAYDNLVQLNPNSYFSSASDTNISSSVSNCANAIKNTVSALSYSSVKSDTSGGYDELRNALVLTKSTTTNDVCYNKTAWNNYTNARKTALSAINNPYQNVINYSDNYYTEQHNSKSIATIASELSSTYNALSTEPKEHTIESYTEKSAATCTQPQILVGHCSVCQLEVEQVGSPALGHTWSEYVSNNSNTHTRTCSVCNDTETYEHSFVSNVLSVNVFHVKSDEINNGYSYYGCIQCGEPDTLNDMNTGKFYDDVSSYWDTYRAKLAQANDKIAENEATNGAKYTSESINELKKAIDSVEKVGDEKKSKEYIEGKTTELFNAVEALDLNQYSITVNYVDATGNALGVGEEGATYKTYDAVDYGTIQNIVAPTNYDNVDYAVYKWTREDKSSSSISGLNSSSLDVVVKGASTYYVFLKNTSVDESQASGNAVITLNNKSNKVYDIGYVAISNSVPVTVDVDKGTITIGGQKLTAPNYSFYNITGFDVNGKIITGTDTVSITKNIVIRPVYKAKQTVRITRATGSNFLINGQDVPSIDVEWNKKIVASTENSSSVIWKAGVDYDGNGTIEDSEKNVVAYGSTYTFYSNSNVTIYTETSDSAPAVPTASIGMFSYDATDNKVTVVNNFYVPDGMKATKAGVILSTKNSTREALIAQTNGKFEGDESQFTTDKNQIRISVSRTANTSFTMYALAYVVVGDKTYYAPTVQSITYTVTNS